MVITLAGRLILDSYCVAYVRERVLVALLSFCVYHPRSAFSLFHSGPALDLSGPLNKPIEECRLNSCEKIW